MFTELQRNRRRSRQISTFGSVNPFFPSLTRMGFSVLVCQTSICGGGVGEGGQKNTPSHRRPKRPGLLSRISTPPAPCRKRKLAADASQRWRRFFCETPRRLALVFSWPGDGGAAVPSDAAGTKDDERAGWRSLGSSFPPAGSSTLEPSCLSSRHGSGSGGSGGGHELFMRSV